MSEKKFAQQAAAGRIGGKAPHRGPRGFAAMTPEQRSACGRKGVATRIRNLAEKKARALEQR